MADLFIVLFDSIVANPDKVGHGREGYYFGENGEHTWYDISKAISKALVELGHGKSEEPSTFTPEEIIKYFGSEVRDDACTPFLAYPESTFICYTSSEEITWAQILVAEETALAPSVGGHRRRPKTCSQASSPRLKPSSRPRARSEGLLARHEEAVPLYLYNSTSNSFFLSR